VQRCWAFLPTVLMLGLLVPSMPSTAAPMTLDQLLTSLKLDKTAIQFSDPETGGASEAPVTQPVPAGFSFGPNGGQLNPTGGSLLVLEGIPVPPPSDISELTPDLVSDILVFPPNGKQFLMFSDPFPNTFPIPAYDSNGNVTGTANKSFMDLLTSGRVNAIQEGFLMDQRTGGKAPFGNDPVNIAAQFGVNDATIFVNRFSSTDSQAYVILSDNPATEAPEPSSAAILAIASAVLGISAIRRRGADGATAGRSP